MLIQCSAKTRNINIDIDTNDIDIDTLVIDIVDLNKETFTTLKLCDNYEKLKE